MLPSIDNRISNLIKSLDKTINPAIDPENGMAQEQGALVIGHLNVLLDQWDKAHIFEMGSYSTYSELAKALVGVASGGEKTKSASSAIEAVLSSQNVSTAMSVSQITDNIKILGCAVDVLITVSVDDGDDGFQSKLQTVVLKYGKHQAWRELVWFKATGLDPDVAELPSIDEMLATPFTLV